MCRPASRDVRDLDKKNGVGPLLVAVSLSKAANFVSIGALP